MTSLTRDTVQDSLGLYEHEHLRGRIGSTAPLSLYLFLLLAIPASNVFAPLGGVGTPATILALAIFVVYLGMWFNPGSSLSRGQQPIRLVGFIFTCVTVASYASANRHLLPALQENAADRGLIFIFGWLGILLLAADGIESVSALQTLIRRQVFGATAVAIIGAIQFATGINPAIYIKIAGLSDIPPATDLLTRGAFNRPAATASHPIEFGAMLVLCLPLALHQARYASPDKRVRRWIQLAIIALVTPMSVSRSAILGLAVIAVVLLPSWSRRERRTAYAFIAAAFAAVILIIPGLVSTIGELFLHISSDSSTASRTRAVGSSWSYIVQNPWLGRGFGTFLPTTYFYVDDQYVTSLIATGIIGLLALVMLFVAGWLIVRSARQMLVDEESRHLGQCLAASVAVAAVSFSDYDALAFQIASGLTFLLLGYCGAYWRFARAG